MALKCIIKSGKSLCIDGPAALYTNSCFITLPSFQENAPTIQFINGALFPRLSPWILPTSSDLSTIIWTLWCFFNSLFVNLDIFSHKKWGHLKLRFLSWIQFVIFWDNPQVGHEHLSMARFQSKASEHSVWSRICESIALVENLLHSGTP